MSELKRRIRKRKTPNLCLLDLDSPPDFNKEVEINESLLQIDDDDDLIVSRIMIKRTRSRHCLK